MSARAGASAAGLGRPPPREESAEEEAQTAARLEAATVPEIDVLPPMNGSQEGKGNGSEALPPEEELIARIAPEVLTTMDELFRAKWIGVKRLRPTDLKNG